MKKKFHEKKFNEKKFHEKKFHEKKFNEKNFTRAFSGHVVSKFGFSVVENPRVGSSPGKIGHLTQNVLALVAILSRANTLGSILKENIHWTIH